MAKLQLHRLVETASKQGRNAPIVVTKEMVEDIYDAINRAVFNGVLERPKIVVRDYTKRGMWGECEGWQRGSRWGPHYTVVIRIEKHFPNLKKLIAAVAHEMVHQWEWDKCGVMTHGTSTFFLWEERLRYKGIRLSVTL
jgi:hypothetical protein